MEIRIRCANCNKELKREVIDDNDHRRRTVFVACDCNNAKEKTYKGFKPCAETSYEVNE